MENLENKIKKAQESEEKYDFLGASIQYKEALQMAQKLSQKEKIKELKNKLLTVGAKINFKTLTVEQHIPNSSIDDFINLIIKDGDGLPIILKTIGCHYYFYPRIKNILNEAKNTMPIMFQLATLTTFSDKGHVIEGGSDPQIAWTAKIYGISQGIITNLYLKRMFETLKQKNNLNGGTLFSYIEQKGIFPTNSLPLIKKGVEKYFEGDYISALHILVPQFESSFLYISEKLGIDIIALNRSPEVSTRTKVLSETNLDSSEFRNVWKEDFCEQVKYILFSPLGYKLRHKIAHGNIDPIECNQSNTELILYLFLVLAGRVEIKSQVKK